MYDKEDDHDENWDQNTSMGTFQKGKNVNVSEKNLELYKKAKVQNKKTQIPLLPIKTQLPRKSPGKDAEDAFFDRNTATGFFDLWFSGNFVNAGFQLNLYLEGVFV